MTATNDWSIGERPAVPPTIGRHAPSFDRLAVVQELLGALAEVTGDGRAHLMGRVITALRGEILSPGLRLTPLQIATLIVLLGELDHQLAWATPDTATFRGRASRVVELLALGG